MYVWSTIMFAINTLLQELYYPNRIQNMRGTLMLIKLPRKIMHNSIFESINLIFSLCGACVL